MEITAITDLGSNLALYNKVYGRGVVIHDATNQTLKVGDGIRAYNSLPTINDPSAGTVTSVALSLPSIFSVTGSPITGSGTLTAGLATQSGNLFFAAPNGTTGTPYFRSIVPDDLGSGGANNRVLTHNGSGGMSWVAPSGGTVTSVALSLPGIFSVSGSPVTGSGTLSAALASQTSNTIFAAPNGATGTPTFRAVVPADLGTGGANGRVLTHDGSGGMSWAIPSSGSLTIGTSSLSSGTVGRILFEGAGNVLQESANLFWDNTNGRASFGQGSSPGATVDIKAPGTTASDIALRVRNNGNTANNFEVTGNGRLYIGGNSTGNGVFFIDTNSPGSGYYIGTASTFTTNNSYIQLWPGGFKFQFGAVNDGFQFYKTGTPSDNFYFRNTTSGSIRMLNIGDSSANIGQFIMYNGNFGLSDATTIGTSATRTLWIKSGTAPTAGGGFADLVRMYSADISAGRAALHVMNEDDTVVKIYQQTTSVGAGTLVSNLGTPLTSTDTIDGYTLLQVVKALRNNGLLA